MCDNYMLFKNIRDEIIKKKTFSQVIKYITNRQTIKNVSDYLKEINCNNINAKVILSSYIIRYHNDTVLSDSKLDEDILLCSVGLHKILESDKSNLIKNKNIKEYIILYNKWKDFDIQNQVNDLISEFYLINKKKKNLKDDDLKIISEIELERIQQKIKKHISLLDPDGGIKLLEESADKYEQINPLNGFENDIRDSFRKTYNNYVRKKLINNDIEVVTKNFKELRGMLLLCVTDEKKKDEIVDSLYIEYLSDEELYKFLLKVYEYILQFSNERDIKDVKKTITNLKCNVSKDKEMHEFIPEIMDEAFTRIERIMINNELKKRKYKKK